MFNFLKKAFADHFEGRGDIQKECDTMNARTEELAELVENGFIEANVNEETLPLFDFEINLNEDQ